ncbi:MAG TPA: oligosaccharide flippase family protein [Gemmatimonadales bacterium]|nr:oligosaccharide flippase family protein [Gemmatimonadales bacterium]
MIRKRQLLVNAMVSVGQVIVTGAVYFVLYRFLLDRLGPLEFGVWALVLATTSAAGIANLGLTTSAVKFVSQYLARDDRPRVALVIQTAVLSVAVFLAVVAVAVYPLLRRLLGVLIDEPAQLPAAIMILPYALASFLLTSVAGVFQSSIDGFQRMDLRGLILTGTTIAYLGLCLLLVPSYGLIGLAWAQVLQAGILVLVLWSALKVLLKPLPLIPWRWRGDVMREMLLYSLNVQLMSVARLLLDPVTKSLISKFGGLSALAFFEFASRMVVQLRALIVTAHMAVIPTIADLQERSPRLIQDLYRQSVQLLLFLVVMMLPLLIGLVPYVSRMWIGQYEQQFVIMAWLLLTGWFLNTLANPAFFANLGIGRLRGNVIGFLITGVLNVVLGVALGLAFGGVGVVLGFAVALVIGSLSIVWGYHREHAIRTFDLLQRQTGVLAVASIVGCAVMLGLYYGLPTMGVWRLAGLAVLTYMVLTLGPAWVHPVRTMLRNLSRILTGRIAATDRRP